MERRNFLKSIAGLTSGLLLSPHTPGVQAASRDRLGDLLPQRRLGKTGEAVTMLGVGGSHVGRMSERDAQATIEAALESGIRFFDSAESYQDGGSERYLGRFLTPKYRDEVFLMTKALARDAEGVRANLEGSLRRLNTDYLDLWQMHSVQDPGDVDNRISQGVVEVMKEAKAEGKVRHIGFTGHNRPSAHRRVLERTDAFETCQMPINVSDASYKSFIEGVLPTLVERNFGVLAMKTLANGRFFEASQQGTSIIPDRISLAQALHFVWALPVSVLISGPGSPGEIKENAALARSFEGMDEPQRQALVEQVAGINHQAIEYYKA